MINVQTGEFYGPFDLLLDLIKSSKYDIYDIQISEITNRYIESLKTLDIPSDETSDFILIATQLLYLKTRSLMKDAIEPEAEEESISQEELIERLSKYKKIKAIISNLRILEDEGTLKFFKFQEDLSEFQEKKELNITYDIEKLKYHMEITINRLFEENEFRVDEILNKEEFSLDKYNAEIKIKLIKERFINISNMLKKVESKSEAVIIFLSILELAKTKNLIILQDNDTLEISINIREDEKKDE